MLITSLRSLTSLVTGSSSLAIGTRITIRSSGIGGVLIASFTTIRLPGPMVATSSAAVSGFITTRISLWPRRAIQPSFEARMVNQVGSPAMFEGNRFFPLTGMPIWKMARSSTLFAVWLPEPLTVATWMLKSLTTGFMGSGSIRPGSGPTLLVRGRSRRGSRAETAVGEAERVP